MMEIYTELETEKLLKTQDRETDTDPIVNNEK